MLSQACQSVFVLVGLVFLLIGRLDMYEFLRLNLKAFCSSEKAVSSLEYAILAVVVLAAIYIALKGDSISKAFEGMSSTIASVTKPS